MNPQTCRIMVGQAYVVQRDDKEHKRTVWSEKERWCLGNVTLGSKLRLDIIEVCDRSKAISKTGTTKTKDVYVHISETRFFKNRTDGNADFTTRLVSKGRVYSWYEGSREDNAFLLEKAGFVPHERCTPYLTHVKANSNCKVDMELFRVDILDVKIPESSGCRKDGAAKSERNQHWEKVACEVANDFRRCYRREACSF